MTTQYSHDYLTSLVQELRKLPTETEWVEFKENRAEPEEIGEYISALANSAALCGKGAGYVVWGIEDKTHRVVGTTFDPHKAKVGEEEIENWLLRHLSPQIEFHFFTIELDGLCVVLLEIEHTRERPVQLKNAAVVSTRSCSKRSCFSFLHQSSRSWETILVLRFLPQGR